MLSFRNFIYKAHSLKSMQQAQLLNFALICIKFYNNNLSVFTKMKRKLKENINFDQQTFQLPKNIPILYLWFGKNILQDYLISLASFDFPIIFLQNPQIKRSFSRELLEIQKSDYYRLQYLYDNGGIYSDFDNKIKYKCLMNLLQPFRNKDKLVIMTSAKHNKKLTNEVMNNLIFAPKPKMQILNQILEDIDEEKQKIWGFAGMKHLAGYQEIIELNMDKCVLHQNDWSWFQDSNKVLEKNRKSRDQYNKKLLTKRQILIKKQQIEKQLQNYKQNKKNIQHELGMLKSQNEYLKRISQQNVKDRAQLNEQIKKDDKIESVIIDNQTSKLLNEVDSSITNKQRVLKDQNIAFLSNKMKQLNQQNENMKNQQIDPINFIGILLFSFIMLILLLIAFKILRNNSLQRIKVDQKQISPSVSDNQISSTQVKNQLQMQIQKPKQ